MEEHFTTGGIGFDFAVGAMHFVVGRPPPIHDVIHGRITSGRMPQLRDLLNHSLQPHILRLVTNKLTAR